MNRQAQKSVYAKLLNLTSGSNSISLERLEKETNITKEGLDNILSELHAKKIISREGNDIRINLEQRLGLAVKLVELGGDLRNISNNLEWLEFEEFVARVFEENSFNVLRRFRFQAEGRRWEVDVLATLYPYVICAECKHWKGGISDSTARKIITSHLEKTEIFSRNIEELFEKIKIHRWKNAIILPITLTLSPTRMKIYQRVYSVSVHALPSFLEHFSGYLEQMTHFKVNIPLYKYKLKQIKLR